MNGKILQKNLCSDCYSSWQRDVVTGGSWSPTRPSMFLTVKEDGRLDCWDLLYNQQSPSVSRTLGIDAVRALDMREDGMTVSAGDDGGVVSVVRISEDLVTCTREERVKIGYMFDREARRERILEVRNRELRFKEKTMWNVIKKNVDKGGNPGQMADLVPIHHEKDPKEVEMEIIEKAEKEFFDILQNVKETREKAGTIPTHGGMDSF